MAIEVRSLDSESESRLVDSLVTRGDISGLSAADRARVYVGICRRLGLEPSTQPLAAIKLNGKEVLYPTRGATDQLAAIHRVNREIIDGPRAMDFAGTKLIYAVCRASLPSGRTETAVATVPLTDPVNALMKCETKAKRRATLSILGLGMLDETELETIPAYAKAPAAPIGPEPVTVAAEAASAPTQEASDSIAEEAEAEAFRVHIARLYERSELTVQAICAELLRANACVSQETYADIFRYALEAYQTIKTSASMADLKRWVWAYGYGMDYDAARDLAAVEAVTASILEEKSKNPGGLAWIAPKRASAAGADAALWLQAKRDAAKARFEPETQALSLEAWRTKTEGWKNEFEARNSWRKNSPALAESDRDSALEIACQYLVLRGWSPDYDEAAAWLRSDPTERMPQNAGQ